MPYYVEGVKVDTITITIMIVIISATIKGGGRDERSGERWRLWGIGEAPCRHHTEVEFRHDICQKKNFNIQINFSSKNILH